MCSVVRRENAKPVKQKALVNNMFNKIIHKILFTDAIFGQDDYFRPRPFQRIIPLDRDSR